MSFDHPNPPPLVTTICSLYLWLQYFIFLDFTYKRDDVGFAFGLFCVFLFLCHFIINSIYYCGVPYQSAPCFFVCWFFGLFFSSVIESVKQNVTCFFILIWPFSSIFQHMKKLKPPSYTVFDVETVEMEKGMCFVLSSTFFFLFSKGIWV